eukprot:31314-Pelagococcus_subviridis.AAC.9
MPRFQEDPKGFWEIFFGKNPNKGKVRLEAPLALEFRRTREAPGRANFRRRRRRRRRRLTRARPIPRTDPRATEAPRAIAAAVPHPVHGRDRVHGRGVHGVPGLHQHSARHLAAAPDLLQQLVHPVRDVLHPVPDRGEEHDDAALRAVQHHAGDPARHLRHARRAHHAVPPHVHHDVVHRRHPGARDAHERAPRDRVLHVERDSGYLPGDSDHHRGGVRAGAGSVSERRATRRDATNADADADANEASGGADAAADGGETRAVARRSERRSVGEDSSQTRSNKPRTTTAAT